MDISEFEKNLPPYKALLGFDYGSKRLGLAVSDLMRGIASSYKILYRSTWEKDLAEMNSNEPMEADFAAPTELTSQEMRDFYELYQRLLNN